MLKFYRSEQSSGTLVVLALYLGPFSTRGFESTCTAWICVPKCVDLSPGVPRGVHAACQTHVPCVDFRPTCPRVTLGPRSRKGPINPDRLVPRSPPPGMRVSHAAYPKGTHACIVPPRSRVPPRKEHDVMLVTTIYFLTITWILITAMMQ